MSDSIDFSPEKMLSLGENDQQIEKAIKKRAESPRRPSETVLRSVYENQVPGNDSMTQKYKELNKTVNEAEVQTEVDNIRKIATSAWRDLMDAGNKIYDRNLEDRLNNATKALRRLVSYIHGEDE